MERSRRHPAKAIRNHAAHRVHQRLWQIRHPTPHLSDSLLAQALPPFPLTVAQTLDVKGLGYDYSM